MPVLSIGTLLPQNVGGMMCGRPSSRFWLNVKVMREFYIIILYMYKITIYTYIHISQNSRITLTFLTIVTNNKIFIRNVGGNVFVRMYNKLFYLDFVYIPQPLWKFMQILCNKHDYKNIHMLSLYLEIIWNILCKCLFTFLHLPRSRLHTYILTLTLAF